MNVYHVRYSKWFNMKPSDLLALCFLLNTVGGLAVFGADRAQIVLEKLVGMRGVISTPF